MKKLIWLIFLLCYLSRLGFAQCSQTDSLYRVLRVVKSDSDKINTLNALVGIYVEDKNYGKASFYAKQSLKMAEKIAYKKGIADALTYIGIVDYRELAQFENAIINYEKVLAIYEDLGDKKKTIKALEILGTYYARSVDLEKRQKALNYFQKALSMVEKTGDDEKTAHLLENIGELYGQSNKDEEALKAFERAHQIKKSMGIEDIRNAHILAKYKRVKAMENQIRNTKNFVLIIAFAIVIAIMAVVTIISVIQTNRAYKLLKEAKVKFDNLKHKA